jgi:hypothetical protein
MVRKGHSVTRRHKRGLLFRSPRLCDIGMAQRTVEYRPYPFWPIQSEIILLFCYLLSAVLIVFKNVKPDSTPVIVIVAMYVPLES